MNGLQKQPRRHDVLTVPVIWAALVLSILIHVAALWILVPRLRNLAAGAGEPSITNPLAVQLAAPPGPVASAVATPPPPRAPESVVPPARAKPARSKPITPQRRAPRVIAAEKPTPTPVETEPAASAPPAAQSSPMPPPPAEDLAAYIEARRRARGEAPASGAPAPSASGESDVQRRDRIVADNLGLNRTATFGHDARNAGGIFEIREMSLDDATFYFFGFDKDIGRNAKQLIEVRKGQNSDIRVAIVRKMISIIREKISGDFLWVSQRLDRQVTLSARPSDNAGLEDFIMRDVFPDARMP